MRTLDPIRLLAAANPRPASDPTALAYVAERDAVRATIDRRRSQGSGRRSLHASRRPAIIGAAIAVVLAVPALAFSGVFDSLFGFSNQGTSVSTSQLELNTVQILEQDNVDIGAGITLLATRDDIAIYASRTIDGRTCLLTGPASGTAPTIITIGTLCESGFPSSQHPLLGNYVLVRKPVTPIQGPAPAIGSTAPLNEGKLGAQSVGGLEGLAADGVATVEAIDADGNVILKAPVVDNVYFARRDVQHLDITVPAAKIVALDADGNVVHTELIPQPAQAQGTSPK
jgi:hypothetical protein